MTREEYDKAVDHLVDQYIRPSCAQGAITLDTYLRRYNALRDKFDESQKEKPSENRSVGTAGKG